jgi:hypothetical protein
MLKISKILHTLTNKISHINIEHSETFSDANVWPSKTAAQVHLKSY